MKRREYLQHGRVTASAVVIDAGLVGVPEAQRRVMDLYQPGTQVQTLDQRRWLVTFPEPQVLEAALAPGMLLVDRSGRLIGAPELGASVDDLAYWSGGSIHISHRPALPTVDPSGWLDVAALPIQPLTAVTLPLQRSPEDPPPAKALDLRKLAHVPQRSAASVAIGQELATGRSARAGRGTGTGTGGAAVAGLLARSRAAFSSALAGLVLRSPLAGEVSRRHAKYLEELTKEFGSGDLEEALRNAIPLGGLGGSAMSLRVPQRRSELRIGFQRAGARGRVPYGLSVYQHLQQTYRRAAERLEQAGRIDEAAFAFAELLNSPAECIALLERHQRFELAAQIAEDRKLDPTLVVRLWWLAGNRDRAVSLARRHNVFSSAIERLNAADPVHGRELRLEWVKALEGAGNLVGAVEAGWPDPQVRHLLTGLVERGLGLGGPSGAAMHAYLLGLQSTDEAATRVRDLLESIDPVDWSTLRAFLVALADSPSEPVLDREICTLALRALVRSGRRDWDAATTRAYRELRSRADPTLVADLPATGGSARGAAVVECPELLPGLVPIFDAAPMPDGRTLVALGETGCRLVTPDGRTAARWTVPTHRIVMADHGGTALLISRRGDLEAIHVLDLTTRKVRYYGAIRATEWADTYDGSIWAVVGAGIAFYDMLADEPSVIWRELEPTAICRRLARDARAMTALVLIGEEKGKKRHLELWTWELPGMRLLRRETVEPPALTANALLLPDGGLIWTLEDGSAVASTVGSRVGSPVPDAGNLVTSQGYVARLVPRETALTDVTLQVGVLGGPSCLRAKLGAEGANLRALSGRVALWDASGRLLTADLVTGRLVTAARLLA